MIDEQIRPLALIKNYLMSESKMVQLQTNENIKGRQTKIEASALSETYHIRWFALQKETNENIEGRRTKIGTSALPETHHIRLFGLHRKGVVHSIHILHKSTKSSFMYCIYS